MSISSDSFHENTVHIPGLIQSNREVKIGIKSSIIHYNKRGSTLRGFPPESKMFFSFLYFFFFSYRWCKKKSKPYNLSMVDQTILLFITKFYYIPRKFSKKCITFFQQSNSVAFQTWFLPSFFVFSE